MIYSSSAAQAKNGIFPIISKLDATPSDPDAKITITDYAILPFKTVSVDQQKTFHASVDCNVLVGDFRGSTTTQSELPIFVGWAFQDGNTGNHGAYLTGDISVFKYIKDIQTVDNTR